MNLAYPIAVEPINSDPQVIQPVLVQQQPIPVAVEKNMAPPMPSIYNLVLIIIVYPLDPTTKILTESQFYVRLELGQSCAASFTYNVFPCDDFGEMDDNATPITVFLLL